MAIVTSLRRMKRYVSKRIRLGKAKRLAHRAYRRCAKQAVHCDKEINEKPRLTPWDII